MDEPASAGSTHGEVDELGDTIVLIRDQFELTVLLVEHHMTMVMGISDKVVAMDFGRKIADGHAAEVAAQRPGDRGLPGSRRMSLLERPRPAAPVTARSRCCDGIDLTVDEGEIVVDPRRQRRGQDDDDAGRSAA